MKTQKIIFIIGLQLLFLKSFAGDATLTELTLHKYIKTSVPRPIKAKARNLSGSNITSFTIGWRLNNGAIKTSQVFNIGGGGLGTTSFVYAEDYLNTLTVSTQSDNTLQVWITAVGDTNHTNDTITFNFKALSVNNYVNKVNLVEESSGNWCPPCAPASTVIESIKALPNTSVAVFHTGDIYENPEADAYFESYFPTTTIYTPSAIFNMGESGSYPLNSQSTAWLTDMTDRSNRITPVGLTMNPTYNTVTRQLDVSVTSTFKYIETGDYYVNVYIVEDGIVGTQVNATNPYTHNNVVRKMLGGIGTSGIIPTNPVVNTDYTNSYSFVLPSTWNVNNLRLIGVVYRKDGTQKNNLNAMNYQFSQILSTTDFSFFPNPATDQISIENVSLNMGDTVSIFNLKGQLLLQKDVDSETMNFNISEFPVGIYLIKVKTENGLVVKKFIKQ